MSPPVFSNINCAKKPHFLNSQFTQNSHNLSDVAHLGFLALDGGAVEAQRRNTFGQTLDVEDALIVPLCRLWLGKVPGCQGDRLGDSRWHVNLG